MGDVLLARSSRQGPAFAGSLTTALSGPPGGWRKRTRFFVGSDAGGQCVRCPGCPQHQRLSGYAKLHRRQWTKVAEAYPKQINKLLAQHLIRQSSAPEKRRRLDLVSCAKCIGSRFGEAGNPGPSEAEGKLSSLENVSLVTAATAKLQSRVVLGFEEWLLQGLSDRALRSLSSCAMAYCTLLRAYGDYLFRSGSPMHLYRHLLAFMQKNRLELRPYMPQAWDLLRTTCTASGSDARGCIQGSLCSRSHQGLATLVCNPGAGLLWHS